MYINKLSCHLWLPNVYQFKGGIQVYLSFFLQALRSAYPTNTYDLFFKNDTHKPVTETSWQNTRFHFSGRWPLSIRTIIFCLNILTFGLLHRPNLIIAAHLNFTVVAYWLNRLLGLKYWILVYGVECWGVQKPALKAALHQSDRILAISNYTKNRLVSEQQIDPGKISLLPCAFDASQFEIRPKPNYLLEKYGLTIEQPVILTVSRLADVERFKGYDQILAAMPMIRQVIPDVHYMIVGKGGDRVRIEQMISDMGLETCVTLAGFVPDESLSDYYNLCDVFAMPSKLEGFGIVYLEAMACGKPVLGGDQDGAVDALDNGRLGALINPDDVPSIASTLVKILKKEYPLPLLYQPYQLRQAVIDLYGYSSFQSTLNELLKVPFEGNQPVSTNLNAA